MKILIKEQNEYFKEGFDKLIAQIPPAQWDFSIKGIKTGSPFDNALNFKMKYENIEENCAESIEINGYFKVSESNVFSTRIVAGSYEYKSGNSTLYSCDWDCLNHATTINILNSHPVFNKYITEYKEANLLGTELYIISKLISDNAIWNVQSCSYYDETTLEIIPYVLVDIESENDFFLLGELIAPSLETTFKSDFHSNLELSMGNAFILRIEANDYSSLDAVKGVTIERVQSGRVNKDFYKSEVPAWLGDVSQYADSNCSHTIDVKDFLIKTTKTKCVRSYHSLEQIKAIAFVRMEDGPVPIEVNAMHCTVCDEYYITEAEYERVRSYGTLCHNVVTEEEYILIKNDIYRYRKPKSILGSYGYNVNAQEDLSDNQRKGIIDMVIANEIMDVDEVISFLEWIIDDRGYLKKNRNANIKWRRDLEYVRTLKNYDRTVLIGTFLRKERIML